MKTIKVLLSAAAIAIPAINANADILINEVMQSNVYCIMDDLNDFPDSWVELYNNGETNVNLEGYKIGLKSKVSSAYTLPSVNIPAGGYALVYCDKAEQGMHTNFRVDSGKGDVYLFDTEGEEIDHVTLKKQPAPDIAYGRKTDGDSKWGYMLTPTPKSANTGGTTETILGPVVFETPGGVWKTKRTINVKLQLPENAPEGAYIIYTTNGSEPTLAKSTKYSGNIRVTKGTVIRAKAVCDGCISIPSNAESYLFLERDVQIPVISIAINDEYLHDNNIGIFANGKYNGWNDVELANFFQNWRRPCNIEYFVAEGDESVINQLCETRVQGGYTRRNALKSMAVYANKRFGEKRLNYEFWPNDKPGVTDNKSIILRNGGNDFGNTYIRDGLMQRIIGRNTNIDWQGYQPAIIFINGEYHAMLAIRERSSEDNISANYGGLEDIDMYENWEELKAGSETAIEEFKEFISTEHTFAEWSEYINIESYTNLMALNYWVYNTDFPHNNTVMWRRTDGTDGRWQWLVKDVDFGLGIYGNDAVSKDYAQYLNTNPDHQEKTGYTLWQQLMKCPEFKAYFIDHLVVYMGDFLNGPTFNAYIDDIWAENHGEQEISNAKWATSWWGPPSVPNNISNMRNWINTRERNMTSIMKNGWKLGTGVSVTVNKDIPADDIKDVEVYYDGIHLTQGIFNGKDYVGRTITLQGDEGSNIVGWTVQVGSGEAETINEPMLSYTISENKAISINAILSESGITDAVSDAQSTIKQELDTVYSEGLIEVYDISGRKVAEGYRSAKLPNHGIYIVKTGKGTSAKISW